MMYFKIYEIVAIYLLLGKIPDISIIKRSKQSNSVGLDLIYMCDHSSRGLTC